MVVVGLSGGMQLQAAHTPLSFSRITCATSPWSDIHIHIRLAMVLVWVRSVVDNHYSKKECESAWSQWWL